MNTTIPIRIGNQPPSGIFKVFDARNIKSTNISGVAIETAIHVGQSHNWRMTTKMRIESINMASVTAMPYAPARLSEVRNPMTSTITAASSVQLMNGT